MNKQELIKEESQVLKALMEEEVHILRELLANLQEEQESLLVNDTIILKMILQHREPILEQMMHIRERRVDSLKKLASLTEVAMPTTDLQDEHSSSIFNHCDEVDNIELHSLKDQMIALFDKMKALTMRNNYLLEGKIHNTKELLKHVEPNHSSVTYGKGGKAKNATSTVTLINKEV